MTLVTRFRLGPYEIRGPIVPGSPPSLARASGACRELSVAGAARVES